MEICEPRTRRISGSLKPSKSCPLSRISPPTTRPGGLIRRAMDIAVTLLPHPLSPTRPRVSPFARLKDTSSTALTTPLPVKKLVFRFRTSRTLFKSSRPPEILREPYGIHRKFLRRRHRLPLREECKGPGFPHRCSQFPVLPARDLQRSHRVFFEQ